MATDINMSGMGSKLAWGYGLGGRSVSYPLPYSYNIVLSKFGETAWKMLDGVGGVRRDGS